VEAELFHADRQTDRKTDLTKLIVAFRNFSNAPRGLNVTTVLYLVLMCWASFQ